MSASPESFRGILKNAKHVYNEAVKNTQTKDDKGFIRLVKYKDIDDAIVSLSKIEGILETKINDLSKNSTEKPKYAKIYKEVIELKENLRKYRQK